MARVDVFNAVKALQTLNSLREETLETIKHGALDVTYHQPQLTWHVETRRGKTYRLELEHRRY